MSETINQISIPPAIESTLAPGARHTARYMALVPHDDGGCQFEIHAGGADVEIHIRADGTIAGCVMTLIRKDNFDDKKA